MPHSHKCYFHKNNKITHFCSNIQCTLPMCNECLPIHLQEHPNTNQTSGVIAFSQAEEFAIKELKNYVGNQNKAKENCLNLIQDAKKNVIFSVNQFFSNAIAKVITLFQTIAEAQKKLNKIQKGSLKTLIYFYSQQKQKDNQTGISQLTQNILQIQKLLKNCLKDENRSKCMMDNQNNQIKQFTHDDINQSQQPDHTAQRGYSFDSRHQLLRKPGNAKSTIDVRMEMKKNNQPNVTTSQPNNKTNVQKGIRAKSNQKHIFQPKDVDKQQYSFNIDRKIDNDESRRKQIQIIRKREEERQAERKKKQIFLKQQQDKIDKDREKQREKFKDYEKQRQREREREKQKQLIKLRQMEIQNQRMKMTRQPQQGNKLRIFEQDSQNLRYGVNREGQFYQNSNWNMEADISKANISKELRAGGIFNEQQYKKPLQINDLNTQTASKQVPNIKISRNMAPSKVVDKKPGLCQNLFSINKQVLSPDEIRKMLQKRIQERSRLISKNKIQNKNSTPSKSTDNLHCKSGVIKSKEFGHGEHGTESQGRWDTKDSIIHQIYQDYRN